MSRWRYWDDPKLRMGDVVMTTRNYRPSWLWRRYCEVRIWWINHR